MDSNKNEMEQIQRGLEAFLEKEMESAQKQKIPGKSRKQTEGGDEPGDPEEIQVIGERWDQGRSRRDFDAQEAYPGDWEPEEESEGWESEYEEEVYPESWESEEDSQDWEDWEDETDDSYRKRPAYGKYGKPPGRGSRQHEGYGEEPPGRGGRRYEDYREEPPRRKSRPVERDEEPPKNKSRKSREHTEEKAVSGKKKSQKKGSFDGADQGEGDFGMPKGKQKGKSAQKKPRRKKSRLKRFLIAAVLIIALLGVGLYQLVGAVYTKMNYKEIQAVAAEPMKQDGVINILLIGNDSRENGEDGRSDAMILLSISSRTKTIYMTSLLRDIYVEIPEYQGNTYQGNRLNAAYAFGGAELLMDTIEQNFDIPVNRYMLVNFEAFANLVDAVDGIELELTRDEIEYVNGYLVEYNMLTGREQGTDNMDLSVADNGPAVVHLNGPQALAYSRNRYIGTDFGRTERQRKILTAVIGKLPGALLTNAGELMDGLMPNLTTNLTRSECFQLSLMAGKLLTYDIVSDNIPQPDTFTNVSIRNMAVLQVDFEANIRYLKEKIYGE